MLLLPQAAPGEAEGICKRLQCILTDAPHEGLPPVHACFGLACAPDDPATVPGLLRVAEERLEQVRSQGS
jgi:hypothetical protein